jgi:hypothetical protein
MRLQTPHLTHRLRLPKKGTHHFVDNPTNQITQQSEYALRRQKRGGRPLTRINFLAQLRSKRKRAVSRAD